MLSEDGRGNVDGAYVCKNCGMVNKYEGATLFLDYMSNCFRIYVNQSIITSY